MVTVMLCLQVENVSVVAKWKKWNRLVIYALQSMNGLVLFA